MPRLSMPVAGTATDSSRPRARSRRNESHRARLTSAKNEIRHPSDFGLGPLFVHTREAVVVGNIDTGRIALWNPAAERLFGWSAAEAVGQPIELLIPPAIVRLHRVGLAAYRRAGGGALLGVHRPFEVPARTMRGEEIHVELTLAPLPESDGAGRYVLALLRDVTDRRRAELRSVELAQAEAMRRQAERAIENHRGLIEDGLGVLERETRKLRRSIAGLGRRAAGSDVGRLDRCRRVLEHRIQRVQRSLDALAIGIEINSGALELRPERVNLVPLVARVVSETRSRGVPHKINLAMPQGLTAYGDPRLLEQVVQTLLDHALNRCPRGGWIDVDLRRPLVGLARLEVRDLGPTGESAAAPQDSPQIGLVQSVADLHGGTFKFEYPPEGGLRSIVTLPTHHGRVSIS